MLETIANSFIFLIFLFIFCLLPGLFLLPKNEKIRALDKLFLAITLGLASYSLVIYFVRLIGVPFFIGYIPFFVLAFQSLRTIKFKKIFSNQIHASHLTLLVIMIIGALVQGFVLFSSAIKTNEGIKFVELSTHDSLQHVYLINELQNNFPPRHPGFAPALVKNYHFLIDLVIASLIKYLPLSTYELYYRIIPVFISMLFSLGVFTFTRYLSKSTWTANLSVALALFSGNAAWFFKFFRGNEFKVSANTFMLDPVIDLLQNPMAVLVFPLMLAGIWGLIKIDQKANVRWSVLSAVCFASLIGFKAWGGVLMILGMSFTAIYMSIFKKRYDYWAIFLLSLILILIIMLPSYDRNTAANLIFQPGWLLQRMVEDADRVNLPNHYFLQEHYRATHNLFRIWQLRITQIFIYLFGNLWIKIIGIYYLLKYLKKPKASFIFILTVITGSLFLPLLFNQGRMAYDIVQFGPYSLVLMSILTAISFTLIVKNFPKNLKIILTILLIILSFPSNLSSIKVRFKKEGFLVDTQELTSYQFLKNNIPKDSVVMVYPTHRNDSTLLVAALSGHPTYFSGKSFALITGENVEERKVKWQDFFFQSNPEARNKIFKEGSIDYLLLTQEEHDKFNPAGINFETIYSNEEAIIYKIQ